MGSLSGQRIVDVAGLVPKGHACRYRLVALPKHLGVRVRVRVRVKVRVRSMGVRVKVKIKVRG